MQFPGQGKPAVGVLFDCDLGQRIDTALALSLLYGLEGKTECRVVSLSTTKSNLKSAALAEVIAKFYVGTFFRPFPIGYSTDGLMPQDTPMLTAPLSRKDDKGELIYSSTIQTLNDTAEPHAQLRNALTAQHDENAIVILAGPATNLVKLMQLAGAKPWIERKVRLLAIAGGNFAGGPPDENLRADIAAAKVLFAEWPSPIVVAGSEIGQALPFPGSSLETGFSWSQAHPIADAYRAYKPMPYDAPTTDLAPVLYAVRPKEGYFGTSEPGSIAIADDGKTMFTPNPAGKHRYLTLDPAQKERILKTYVEIVSAKPVPRRNPFRPQQQQQQQQPNAPKPDAAKPSETKPSETKPSEPKP